jgi:hypothetical protein
MVTVRASLAKTIRNPRAIANSAAMIAEIAAAAAALFLVGRQRR